MATGTKPRPSNFVRSIDDGFSSFTFDPSPDLRRRAARYRLSSATPAFIAVFLAVGRVLRRAAGEVMTDGRDRS